MALSRTSVSRLTRGLLVASVAAVPVLVMASPASATANVTRADYSAGNLQVAGLANAGRTITVDGVAMATTTISSGSFTINRSGYTPPADCTVDINDGSFTPTTVLLKGCTPTAAAAAILPDRAELGPFQVGVRVSSRTVSFDGSIGPDTWKIVSGALPAGLTMTVPQADPARPRPNTPEQITYALITGTPTKAGTSTVTFKATDVRGLTATRTYTITVDPSVPVGITPEPWSGLTTGEFTNLWIDGSGGLMPYGWSVAAGALPPGMTLIQDSTAGPNVRVGGTPTTGGTFTWTLRLTDVQGATTTRDFTTTVAAPVAPAPEPTPIPTPTPQPAPVFMSIQSLSLDQTSVNGGTATTGTVTISTAAPAGGTSVLLSSLDPQVASVPATVTVPEGATSATFPITTAAVTFDNTVSIEATYAGTLIEKLTVTAPVAANADKVSVSRAEYDSAKRQLRVSASSSATGATLRVYFTGTDTLIGALSAGSGQFDVTVNPVNITVRSSLGGSGSLAVAAK